jgi:hypothetical protein
MSNKKGKVKFVNLGTMIEKRDKATGEPVLDQNGNRTYYLKIDKNSKVVINGVQVEGYINVSRPRDKFDRMLEKGKIDAQEHEQKVDQYEKGGDFDYAKFELTAVVEE